MTTADYYALSADPFDPLSRLALADYAEEKDDTATALTHREIAYALMEEGPLTPAYNMHTRRIMSGFKCRKVRIHFARRITMKSTKNTVQWWIHEVGKEPRYIWEAEGAVAMRPRVGLHLMCRSKLCGKEYGVDVYIHPDDWPKYSENAA